MSDAIRRLRAMSVTIQEIQRIFSRCEVEGDAVILSGKMSIEIRNLCIEALQAKSPAAPNATPRTADDSFTLIHAKDECHALRSIGYVATAELFEKTIAIYERELAAVVAPTTDLRVPDEPVELRATDVMVRIIRKRNHMGSVLALAEAIGISEQYLCDILRGRRDFPDKLLESVGVERAMKYYGEKEWKP